LGIFQVIHHVITRRLVASTPRQTASLEPILNILQLPCLGLLGFPTHHLYHSAWAISLIPLSIH
jgi:hypothetical protein